MSCVMRKTDVCVDETKDANKMSENSIVDERLCFST